MGKDGFKIAMAPEPVGDRDAVLRRTLASIQDNAAELQRLLDDRPKDATEPPEVSFRTIAERHHPGVSTGLARVRLEVTVGLPAAGALSLFAQWDPARFGRAIDDAIKHLLRVAPDRVHDEVQRLFPGEPVEECGKTLPDRVTTCRLRAGHQKRTGEACK